jgi:DNA gyrase subunit B
MTKKKDSEIQAAQADEYAAGQIQVLKGQKGALESGVLPGKLADCSLDEPSMCEPYLVEGDSADGCFTGDTRIVSPSGKHPSFQEMLEMHAAGKKIYCYSTRPDGTVGIVQVANPRLTRKAASVVRVKLDNDDSATCTPDHLFMLRDQSYRRADELKPGDALRSLQRGLATEVDHQVVAVEPVSEAFDVYDIEAPDTQNFALTSGVFVHNSAKQGRDRQYQAIL